LRSYKQKKQDFGKLIKKAQELIKSRNFKKAIEELEKNKFRDVDYYLLLAEAYEGIGDREKAEIYFEEARFLDTELRSKNYLQRGITLASIKNFKAAEKELLKSLELNPFDREVYVELYKLYRNTNSKRNMVKALENAITVDPYFKFPYVELAKHYSLIRNYRKAAEILKRGIELIGSADLHYELGRVYAELGKLEEAKEELKEACRLDYRNVDYRQKLIEVMVNDEDYEGALQVLYNTLEIYPNAVFLIQSLAAVYDMLGNEELAEHYYRKAVSLSEGFIREDAMKALSDFFIDKGRYDQAEEVLKELISETDNPWILLEAFSDLSIILLEQGRLEEIVEVGSEVLKNPELMDDEFCEVAEVLGDVLFELARFEEAKKYYGEILERSADEKLIKRAYGKLKEIEEIESLERLLRAN
jgi:tetratricopeptide (TPR) repeat protein